MFPPGGRKHGLLLAVLLCLGWGSPGHSRAESPAKVYVLLWFDTEDYILPASDDSALRLADFLSREKIRGTFKVVGEKARTLERRGRTDVIAALKKHEIGYHANYHSVQPSPAMYLADLGWDDGVAEFDRRDGPGRDDVQRVFGSAPTCYGQPGSSWGPQAYGAMRKWGMEVYLDAGRHVGLEDKPCYFCGVLNLYKLAYVLRAELTSPGALKETEDKFLAARRHLLAEGGGVISIYYHPCEFIHAQFWDAVNFSHGANPPREQWKLPPTKTPAEIATAYRIFEDYVHFMKRFPEVQFITASQAAHLYRDRARNRPFTPADLKAMAADVQQKVTFQKRDGYALSAAEVLVLLNGYVADFGAGHQPDSLVLKDSPYGPSDPVKPLGMPLTVPWNQLTRTAADVADYLRKQGRVPGTVWLGSVPVPPEAYLQTLGRIVPDLVDGKPTPETIDVKPAVLAAADHVADDGPTLWDWVIFPPGFRAPALMELAKRQAWTLKPAILDRPAE